MMAYISKILILVLLMIISFLSKMAYCRAIMDPNGGLRLCDPANPCPPGSQCMYSSTMPGVKACFIRVSSLRNKSGTRCPLPNTYVIGTRMCDFDEDCSLNERCCNRPNIFSKMCLPQESIAVGPAVTVLVPGSMEQTTSPPGFRFVGTVSLVQSNGRNVMFDTGGVTAKIPTLNALRDVAGLHPNDIDMVVTSHGHPDHYANVNLFPDVPGNFDAFTLTQNQYTFNTLGAPNPSPFYLFNDTNLELIQTPGHTPQDTSLIVRNVPQRGTVALVGDLFFFQQDYLQPELRESSFDPQLFERSRKTVACLADYIVPGHGPMFQVNDAVKQAFEC